MDVSRAAAPFSGLPGGVSGLPIDRAAAPCRPLCEAGVDSPDSTSLKWGADGELTAQDLHHVMARLLACDPEALRMLEADPPS